MAELAQWNYWIVVGFWFHWIVFDPSQVFDLCSWRIVYNAHVFSWGEVLASELINLMDFNHGEVTGLFTMCRQYPSTSITNLAVQQLKSLLYLAALPKSSPNSVSGFVCQIQGGSSSWVLQRWAVKPDFSAGSILITFGNPWPWLPDYKAKGTQACQCDGSLNCLPRAGAEAQWRRQGFFFSSASC